MSKKLSGCSIINNNINFQLTSEMIRKINMFNNNNRLFKLMWGVEIEILDSIKCSKINKSIIEFEKINLSNMLFDQLANIVRNEYTLNWSIHDEIRCLVESVTDQELVGSNNQNSNEITLNERMNNWFRNIIKIPLTGIEGNIFKTSLLDNSEMFVIKTPLNPEDDNLVHEAVVGMLALNNLRKYIPNFMYVYGVVKCPIPKIVNGKIIEWCGMGEHQVSYLITENVHNSISFSKFIKSEVMNSKTILDILIQIFNALNVAYHFYQYRHDDLHYGNVMIREFKRPIAVPIYDSNMRISKYIVSRYVPYLIDYGFSEIVYDGTLIRSKNYTTNRGKSPDPNLVFVDCYRIISYIGLQLYEIQKENKSNPRLDECFKIMNVMRSTINPSQSYEVSYQQVLKDDYNWFVFRFNNRDNLRIIDFMNAIDQKLNIDYYSIERAKLVPNIVILPINRVVNSCDFMDLVKLGDRKIENGIEFCNTYINIVNNNQLSDQDKNELVSIINREFSSLEYYQRIRPMINNYFLLLRNNIKYHIDRGENMIDDFMTIANGPNKYKLTNITFYQNNLQDSNKIKEFSSVIFIIQRYVRGSICSFEIQRGNQKYIDELNYYANEIEIYREYILKQLLIYDRNINFINSDIFNKLASETIKDYIRKNDF